MRRRINKRRNLVLIPIGILIILAVFAAAVLISIEVRYRGEEKKVLSVPSEISDDMYYFNQLTYKEQLLFKSIKKAAESYEKKSDILPYRYSEQEFQRVVKALNFDCPLLFYLDINSIKLYCDDYKTNTEMSYLHSPTNITKMKMELEAVSAAAMAYTQNADNEFEKAVILHDFLTSTCTYVNQSSNGTDDRYIHTAYGALVNRNASCDGYSSAYKILLNRCGIECIIAEGTADGQPHLWNIANQDGDYYHIDCTWDDSDTDFISELSFHGYFNLSDSVIKKTHQTNDIFSLPVCSAENNYYAQINAVPDSVENFENTAYEQIKKAVEKELNYFELFVSFTKDESDYKESILNAIDRVNAEYLISPLSRSYRVFAATNEGDALTVQLYYINK